MAASPSISEDAEGASLSDKLAIVREKIARVRDTPLSAERLEQLQTREQRLLARIAESEPGPAPAGEDVGAGRVIDFPTQRPQSGSTLPADAVETAPPRTAMPPSATDSVSAGTSRAHLGSARSVGPSRGWRPVSQTIQAPLPRTSGTPDWLRRTSPAPRSPLEALMKAPSVTPRLREPDLAASLGSPQDRGSSEPTSTDEPAVSDLEPIGAALAVPSPPRPATRAQRLLTGLAGPPDPIWEGGPTRRALLISGLATAVLIGLASAAYVASRPRPAPMAGPVAPVRTLAGAASDPAAAPTFDDARTGGGRLQDVEDAQASQARAPSLLSPAEAPRTAAPTPRPSAPPAPGDRASPPAASQPNRPGVLRPDPAPARAGPAGVAPAGAADPSASPTPQPTPSAPLPLVLNPPKVVPPAPGSPPDFVITNPG